MVRMLGALAWSGVCACRDCGNNKTHRHRKRGVKRRERRQIEHERNEQEEAWQDRPTGN